MRALVLSVVLVGIACGSKGEERPAPRDPVGSAGAQPAAGAVQLFVGDKPVATIDRARVADWPRLDTLLPQEARRLGKWASIATTGAKTSELAKPFERYRDYVPALFPGDGASVSFGLFDPVEYGKRGTPALREDMLREVRVVLDTSGARGENEHQGGDIVDPAKLELAIVSKTGERKLTGTQLLALDRVAQPGGGEAKGWPLAAVLRAAGVESFAKIRLTGDNGISVPLEGADLAADNIPFLKLNRQGSLRFRLYKKQGDGFQSGSDLRGVSKIEVLE